VRSQECAERWARARDGVQRRAEHASDSHACGASDFAGGGVADEQCGMLVWMRSLQTANREQRREASHAHGGTSWRVIPDCRARARLNDVEDHVEVA
jgi:hypothetical protein